VWAYALQPRFGPVVTDRTVDVAVVGAGMAGLGADITPEPQQLARPDNHCAYPRETRVMSANQAGSAGNPQWR
jgi:succinate dehydrogenase/fumarate reductase flavoprotein subunit